MASEAWELERRYSVPGALDTRGLEGPPASEDLHAWSIYRQNLNSDFTDSALGSAEKSPLPYGNFQLRDSTVQSILRHPRYGPRSPLASNSYAYLKFGLPRVLPPSTSRQGNGPRDAGSSGYDSSEEGRARAAIASGRISAFACVPAMRSARSDPDFRNAMTAQGRDNHVGHHYQQHHNNHYGHQQHLAHQQQMKREARMRSASEANLLATSNHARPGGMSPRPPTNRRHSIAPYDPGLLYDTRHSSAHVVHPQIIPQSMSPIPQQPQSYQPVSQVPQHPHMQLRGIEANGQPMKKGTAYLRGITMEAGACDILAVMSTLEKEGTLIMEVISGRRPTRRGDILLNGRVVSDKVLRSTVSYLPADTPEAGLSPNLTSIQCLSFYRQLRGAAGVSTLEMEAIIQELGLDATKHCLVSSLTCCEARRLSLACRLIEGTQILCLDRPTRGLDIFDTFFLVEYLRQWAMRTQRLVILTLHPPTYEILTMLSRVALTSGGRVMYAGPRRDMLPYFALAEFPCPPFKNPSDYYLDLVTLDDLSAEAMLESSQRIDHLADLARNRLPALSDPGPPGHMPPINSGVNLFGQFYALLLRTLVYSQPLSLATLFRKILIAGSLSVILGVVFWKLSDDRNLNLKDRVGFHYASMGILFWPLSLLGIAEVLSFRPCVERDIADGLYNRFVYILVELICSLPSWSLVYIAYLGPAYVMTGLPLPSSMVVDSNIMPADDHLDSLLRYLHIGLVYLLIQHYVCVFFAYLFSKSWSFLTVLMSAMVIGASTLGAGFTLHLENLYSWYGWVSPLRWAFAILLKHLHSKEIMLHLKECKSKQVQSQDIIKGCDIPDGELSLREIALDDSVYRLVQHEWLLESLGCVLAVVVIVFLSVRHSTMKNTLTSVPNYP